MDAHQREWIFENLPTILAADAQREHVEMVLQPGHEIVNFFRFQDLVHGILADMRVDVYSGSCGHESNYEKMRELGISYDNPRGHRYTVSFQTETLANRFMIAVAKIVAENKTFPFIARPPQGPVGLQSFQLIQRLDGSAESQ